MKGKVSKEELDAALGLSDEVKNRINAYERNHWAANLDSPDMQISWGKFLSKLGHAIKNNSFSDELLVSLIHYLSTMDTVKLLDEVRKLDESRQTRFLQLLDWVAEESPDPSQRANAKSVKERILMAYRLNMYPEIYSPARLARAAQIVSSSINKEC